MPRPLYAVEREYPVSIDRLWSAWIEADALEAWYHPTDLSVVPGSVVSDPVVGGWWTVGVDVPSEGYVAYFFGRYLEVEPRRRLVHTLAYTQDAEAFAARDPGLPADTIEIDLEDRGATSWVRFRHVGDLSPEEAEGARQGMESYFDSLGSFLGGSS